jgi:5-methylcytosine-specific restriction endonuclease McrA
MATKLRRHRRQAFIEQHGNCFYCGHPIWEEDRQAFATAHGIPVRLSSYLMCTAEHLVARKDNGKDSSHNIVAACLWCNGERHRGRSNHAPDPVAYRTWVRMQIGQAKWHPVVASRAARGIAG